MPEDDALISVIVPVHNAAPWLRRCLDSIIGQTRRELEVILVNDGSTDAGPELCREYEAGDRRIVVVDQDNRGPAEARNLGLDRATGKYLMFVDADDYIEPEMAAILHAALERDSCGWALCGCRQFSDAEPDAAGQVIRLLREGAAPAVETLMGFARGDVKVMTTFASLWNKVYWADIVRRLGLRFGTVCPGTDIPVYPQEDFFFNLDYLAAIETAAFVDLPLYHYRMHRTTVNAVRKYRPHAWELHREVYGAVRLRIWGRCTPEERRNFNRHFLDKTLIVMAMLCRDNPLFGPDALREKMGRMADSAEVTEALGECSPNGSQDNRLFESLRRRDFEALYFWARQRGNENYKAF